MHIQFVTHGLAWAMRITKHVLSTMNLTSGLSFYVTYLLHAFAEENHVVLQETSPCLEHGCRYQSEES